MSDKVNPRTPGIATDSSRGLAESPSAVFAAAAALVLAGCLAYLPALEGTFLNYDDTDYVTENPHVTGGLTFENLRWALTTSHAANWHPLTWVSHQIDASIFGPKEAVGPHAVNLFLHLACSVTLFAAFLTMTGRFWPSFVVAGLFTLHPINVETVAWVSQRKSLLSTLFFLLAMLVYVRYSSTASTRSWLACLTLYACSLLAKPMLVTGPLLLLLLDAWPLDRIRRKGLKRCILEKVPFLMMAGISCGITLWAQQGAMASSSDFSLGLRATNAIVATASYLGSLVWPVALSPIYPHPRTIPNTGTWITAIVILLAISTVAFLARRRRYLPIGWLWYLIALIPTLGFVQVGLQSMADRYAYVPFIGLYGMLAWLVADIIPKASSWRTVAGLGGVSLAVLLGFATFQQASVWRDSFHLFGHAIALDPENYVAHYHLSDVYESKGDLPAAAFHEEEAYRSAYRAGYRNVLLPVHLATLWARTNRRPQARQLLQKVIAERPDFAPAYAHLAEIAILDGDGAEAEKLARTALRLDRGNELAKQLLTQLRLFPQ